MKDRSLDNITISASEEVYCPREDSYLLARAVDKYAFGKTLDMGTGSGIQGIVAAKKGCDVTFSDVSQEALDCAAQNAKANSVCGRFVKSDMFDGISGRFDSIIFNPPYLPHEDHTLPDKNLDGGPDGRKLVDRFIRCFSKHVNREHVVLLLESSLDRYEQDIKKLNATIICRDHLFFEELVVLMVR